MYSRCVCGRLGKAEIVVSVKMLTELSDSWVMGMPYCSKCGAELPKDARFCPSCGTPSQRTGSGPVREHRSFKVAGKPKVVIFHRAPGRIDVNKGSEGEVTVDSDLWESADLDWSVAQESDVVTVRARALVHPFRWPRYFFSGGPRADLAVLVPAEADLDVSTSLDQVVVVGVKGMLSIEASVARVSMEKCEGTVRITGKTGQIDLKEVSGTVAVDSTTGPVTLENVNGTVSVRNTTGPVRFLGNLSGGENRFRTNTGPIEVALQGQSDLAVEAYSRLGSVTCIPELAGARYERGQYTGRIGSGAGKLIVESTTGPITIHH